MALSVATASSLSPAPTRILVAFRFPDISMPWYWSLFLSEVVFQKSSHCRQSTSLRSGNFNCGFLSRWRGLGSEPQTCWHHYCSAWSWRPTSRSRGQAHRLFQGWETGLATVGSDRWYSDCGWCQQTAAPLLRPGARGGTDKDYACVRICSKQLCVELVRQSSTWPQQWSSKTPR